VLVLQTKCSEITAILNAVFPKWLAKSMKEEKDLVQQSS